MQRLIQNALWLRTELTQFIETQIESRNENLTHIPERAWKAEMTMMPILKTFKYSIEILETERMGTLAHVPKVEIMPRNFHRI
jgi:hypothetical protein